MTFFVALLVTAFALGVGLWVGLRRGPALGAAAGAGALAAGALGYFTLLALSLPM